jgi:transcriptional regulator with XRE-family HTH domain
MFRVVENVRLKHLDWVHSILATKKWTQHRLAKEAGLSPSALNKFMKDPTNTRTLGSYSIEKLELASGMPLPVSRQGQGAIETAARGDEAELLPDDHQALPEFMRGTGTMGVWLVKSRALELAGFLPGDLLLTDKSQPMRGQTVVAEVPGRDGGREIVIRRYEPPILVSATTDPALLSAILLNQDVVILGVMAHSVRNRQAA